MSSAEQRLRGAFSLSGDELAELALLAVGVYGRCDCSRCGLPIPWSEMIAAWDNGGLCAACAPAEGDDADTTGAVSGGVLP